MWLTREWPRVARRPYNARSFGNESKVLHCFVNSQKTRTETPSFQTTARRLSRIHGEEGNGEPAGTRTLGPKIKSLVLYQLSYGLTRAG